MRTERERSREVCSRSVLLLLTCILVPHRHEFESQKVHKGGVLMRMKQTGVGFAEVAGCATRSRSECCFHMKFAGAVQPAAAAPNIYIIA
eukprot:8783-Heterococcus_DN1.PRE.2